MRRALIASIVAATLGNASPGQAQAPPGRSYQGIFGGAVAGASRPGSALSMTFLQAYDDNLGADQLSVPESVVSRGGFFNALLADFNYRSTGRRRTQFATTAGTSLRYYPEVQQVVGVGHYAGAGMSTTLGRSTALGVSQTVAYAPAYWYRLFAAPALPAPGEVTVASDYALDAQTSYNYRTSVDLTRPLGRRNTLALLAAGRYTNYVNEARIRDYWSYDLGGTFSRGLSPTVRFTAGYVGRRTSVYGVATPEHDVTVGFDYGRHLSATRTATLAVSLGAAVLQQPIVDAPPSVTRTAQRLIAHAAFDRQFGRTWDARAAYDRGFSTIEGIAAPLSTDGLTVTAAGFVSRTVDLSLLGSYTRGDPSLYATATSGFTTSTGSARARLALSEMWAVYLEYVYYHYDFRDIVVPPGVPPTASRNAVRAGVTTWFPLTRSR